MSADSKADDEGVPKLPRGRGLKFAKQDLFRIGFLVITLVGVLVMTKPCADSVSSFVTGFEDGTGSANAAPAAQPEPQYERLTPDMTEAELKEAIERSKARAGAVDPELGDTTPAP